MEPSHKTHVSEPAVLDNSHYVSETFISTNAPTVEPIFALVVNRSSTSNSPVQSFTPRSRGRLKDKDFGDVQYGDIRASDAQITTRWIITEHSPELPASQSPTQEVASQDQLLQLRAH